MFATVAWASDGSEAAAIELAWVAQFAARQTAMLWAVHIASPAGAAGDAGSETEEADIARLKGQVRELRDHGLAASLYVVRGAQVPIGVAISAAARAVRADLLVLGPGEGSADLAPAPGGVVRELLTTAPCPVLMLPPPVSSTPARAAAHR
jgi:nucleotide-binding universal stress UspA family protein